MQETGGAEKMQLVDAPTPQPGPKQALVRLHASGVNFINVYFRIGLYKADLPITLGGEGAGVVEAVGPEVTEVAVGDRVAYAMARGSYAQYAVVPAWQLVKIPAHVEFTTAAAAMLQGMTAHYLTHSTFALKSGKASLVHAAGRRRGQPDRTDGQNAGCARSSAPYPRRRRRPSRAPAAPMKPSSTPSRISKAR